MAIFWDRFFTEMVWWSKQLVHTVHSLSHVSVLKLKWRTKRKIKRTVRGNIPKFGIALNCFLDKMRHLVLNAKIICSHIANSSKLLKVLISYLVVTESYKYLIDRLVAVFSRKYFHWNGLEARFIWWQWSLWCAIIYVAIQIVALSHFNYGGSPARSLVIKSESSI